MHVWADSQCRALSEAPGCPHKGSALAGRRGNVSSDPTAWRGAPAQGVASAVQGKGNEGGDPVALLRCQPLIKGRVLADYETQGHRTLPWRKSAISSKGHLAGELRDVGLLAPSLLWPSPLAENQKVPDLSLEPTPGATNRCHPPSCVSVPSTPNSHSYLLILLGQTYRAGKDEETVAQGLPGTLIIHPWRSKHNHRNP